MTNRRAIDFLFYFVWSFKMNRTLPPIQAMDASNFSSYFELTTVTYNMQTGGRRRIIRQVGMETADMLWW